MKCPAVNCLWHEKSQRKVYKERPNVKARPNVKRAWPLHYSRTREPCPWCARAKSSYWRLNKDTNTYYCNHCSTYNNKHHRYPHRRRQYWNKLYDRFNPEEDEWAVGLVNEDGTMKTVTLAEDPKKVADSPSSSPSPVTTTQSI